jgi:hypothetical protein
MIHVRDWRNDDAFFVDASLDDGIEAVKYRISERLNVPIAQQRLVWADTGASRAHREGMRHDADIAPRLCAHDLQVSS